MSVARAVWKSTALTAGAAQVTAMLAFASSIVIARAIAPDEIGRYALAAAIVAIATSAGSMQMGGFCIVSDDLTPSLLRSSLGVELSTGCAAFVLFSLGVLGYAGISGDAAFAGLLLLGGLVLLTNPFTCLGARFNRDLSYGPTTRALIGSQLAGAIVKMTLALVGLGAWGLMLGDVAVSLFYAVAMLRLVPEGLRPTLDRRELRAQLQFGVPSQLTGVLSTAAQRGQDIVVAASLGTRQLGFFYLASRICGQVYQLCRSLTNSLLPAFSQAADHELRRRFTAVTRMSALFVAFPLAVLIADSSGFVTLFFGEPWLPAATPLVLLFAAVSIRFVFWHVGNLLKARRRVREMTVLTAVQLALLLSLMYAGARIWGLIGVSVAALLVELVLVAPRIRLIRSVVPFSLWDSFHVPLAVLATASLCALAVASVTGGLVGLVLVTLVSGAVCTAGLWLTEAPLVLVALHSLRGGGGAAHARS